MDSRWRRIRYEIRRRGQARLGLEMSISRLPPFPSFFYSDLPRCSVRPSVNAATAALISVLSRCGYGCNGGFRGLRRVRRLLTGGGGGDGGFGVDYFFRRRRSGGRARQTLDLSAAPTATAAVAAVDRARERSTAGEGHNEFFSAFLPSFPPVRPRLSQRTKLHIS